MSPWGQAAALVGIYVGALLIGALLGWFVGASIYSSPR